MVCWQCDKQIDPLAHLTINPITPNPRKETVVLVQDYTKSWWSFSRLDCYRLGKWILNYHLYTIDRFSCPKCNADLSSWFTVERYNNDCFIKDIAACTLEVL